MHDLDKRIKKNPFLADAKRIFSENGYHLFREEFGKFGAVDLIVFMDNREGQETEQRFSFPAKMEGVYFLKWQDGLRQNIKGLETQGFRCPRSQSAPRSIKSIQQAASPLHVEAEKLFNAIKHDAPVLAPQMPMDTSRILTLKIDAGDVEMILSTLRGVAEIVSLTPVNVAPTMAPITPVDDLAVAVQRSLFHEEDVKPKQTRIRNGIPGGLLGLLKLNIPNGKFRADDMIPLVKPNYPHLDDAEIRRRVSTHFSAMVGVDIERVGVGLYRKV
jgi:hypothetical protein